jgi:solute carrier family 66, member 2
MTVFFVVIIGQRMVYGNAPPMSVLLQDDELEQALSLADE